MAATIWQPTLPPFRQQKKKVFGSVIATGQFIYHIGESPWLRKLSKPIPIEKITTEEYKKKFSYIKQCLRKFRKLTGLGRGIAGAQVGIPEQLAVIYQGEKKDKMLIIINPHITASSQKMLKYSEVCMSASPIMAPVVRPAWIEFSYFDEQGQEQFWTKKADDKRGLIYNRVFQHEIDHLHGMINIDRALPKDLLFDLDPKFYDTASFEEV